LKKEGESREISLKGDRVIRTTRFLLALCAATPLVAPAAAPDPSKEPAPKPAAETAAKEEKTSKMIKTPSGLQFEDTVVGTGASPKPGQTCVMHYTGWLWENGAKGKKFDSSVDRGQPFEFQIGLGMVIKGWDEGVMTMKVGGKRTLIIPASIGYGSRGAGGVIPPNATLVFDVELLGIK
jgi:peptidylprolyl isomerase